MSAHALFSPSGAHKWMNCPASLALEEGLPNPSSDYAAEGTAAHSLAAMALFDNNDTSAYLGRVIHVDGEDFEVDDEMASEVQKFVNLVRERIEHYKLAGAVSVELRVEQKVDLSKVIDVPDQFGTADVQLIVTWPDDSFTIETIDLKYGKGVQVFAKDNEQLQLYSGGLAYEVLLLGDIAEVSMIIHQPRLNHVDEWQISHNELVSFIAKTCKSKDRCQAAIQFYKTYGELHEKYFSPGEDTCRFCRAKATCPELVKQTMNTVIGDFADLSEPLPEQLAEAENRLKVLDATELANCQSAVDLIESWCKAVRSRVEAELFAGRVIPGYKLVEGRKGHRKWSDAEEAEQTLKAMRLKEKEMYEFKLISPTTAEKLHKSGTIGPRQWPKLLDLITQAEGSPSVAPESDKRPALQIKPVEDEFEDISGEAEDLIGVEENAVEDLL